MCSEQNLSLAYSCAMYMNVSMSTEGSYIVYPPPSPAPVPRYMLCTYTTAERRHQRRVCSTYLLRSAGVCAWVEFAWGVSTGSISRYTTADTSCCTSYAGYPLGGKGAMQYTCTRQQRICHEALGYCCYTLLLDTHVACTVIYRGKLVLTVLLLHTALR